MRSVTCKQSASQRLLIPLLAILLCGPPAVRAQRHSGQRMSVGSKWSRQAGSRPNNTRHHQRQHGHIGFHGTSRRTPRIFGGVTVGPGFHPYYYPGYYGNYPYQQPNYLFPLGFMYSRPGFQVSVGTGYLGSPYYGGVPVLPPYSYRESARYSSPYPATPRAPIGAGKIENPVSRARLNTTPRVDFGPTFGSQAAPVPPKVKDLNLIKAQIVAAVAKTPVSGEFAAAARHYRPVTAVEKIESLHLQTQGDQALRKADLELARTFYQAAVRAAPTRQSSWVRMAWVQVFQRDYAKAAMAMNRAMLIHNDTEIGWIRAEDLLGNNPTDQSILSDTGLWGWLQDQPGSADRILLVASYQYFLGHDRIASDLLELAYSAGISQSTYEFLIAILRNKVEPNEGPPATSNESNLVSDESDTILPPPLSPNADDGMSAAQTHDPLNVLPDPQIKQTEESSESSPLRLPSLESR